MIRSLILSTPLSLGMGYLLWQWVSHWGDWLVFGSLGVVLFAGLVWLGDAFGPGVAVLRDRSRIRVSALSRAIHYRKGEVK